MGHVFKFVWNALLKCLRNIEQLSGYFCEIFGSQIKYCAASVPVPRKRTSTSDSESKNNDDILSLLQAQSAKEKADQQHRDEILELLGKPTAKEQVLIDSFRSQTG